MSIIQYGTAIIAILMAILYFLIKYRYSYFKRKGIAHLTPKFPNGNITGKIPKDIKILYATFKNMNEPFFGAYFLLKPQLILKDLDLIKSILIKDFHYFPDRGSYIHKNDPLSSHLFGLPADKWKDQRAKLTPTFTSGKMRYMFPTVGYLGQRLVDVVKFEIKSNSELEFKQFLIRFTTDVIGNVAFGLECNSLKDPNTEFLVQGQNAVCEAFGGKLKRIIVAQFHVLAKLFQIKLHTDETINFFTRIVQETIDLRAKEKIERNDFMNLLLKLKKTEDNPDGFDFNQILANCFVFFIGGFETTSTLMNFALYELAMNQNIQDKCREEILEVLKNHNNELTYEALSEMHYVDRVLNETLRKHPPASFATRSCGKNYPVPNSNHVIEKGITVVIPIYEIHNDEKYYPNPHIFDPDRFLPQEVQKRHPMAFISFGDGPRNCIALRFARMQAKIGLVMLLKNFIMKPGAKLIVPLEINPRSIALKMEGGLWLEITNI